MTGTIKITALANAGVLDGTERVPIVVGGVTKQATTQQIAQLATVGSELVSPSFVSRSSILDSVIAQGGVLLDTLWQVNDADDTASLTRAVAAGVPILLGPRTYTINNFFSGNVASIVMRGVPGVTTIRRTSATGSNFVTLNALKLHVEDVIFDSNRASVTATQWGVLCSRGGQDIEFRGCVFKNNSGAIGSGLAIISTGPAAGGSFIIDSCEVTSCTFNALFIGSACNGIIDKCNVHDNSALGINVTAYTTPTATNYVRNVEITNCQAHRNTVGIQIGEYGAPYSFATIPAQYIIARGNFCEDNSVYGLSLQGYDIIADNNEVTQSSAAVSMLGGIGAFSTRLEVINNRVALDGITYGIDVGSSVSADLRGNTVIMTTGSAINIGGTKNSSATSNHLIVSGSASAIIVFATETDGNGSPFPTICSNLRLTDNTIEMSGAGANGIRLIDNPGGSILGSTAAPVVIEGNNFIATGGAFNANAIIWYGQSLGLTLGKNSKSSGEYTFVEPNVNGDILVDMISFGNVIQGSVSTVDIRSFVTTLINTYGGGGSILWVSPISGGAGYTAATTLAATGSGGGSGWVGTPLIYGGAIIGVRTSAFGSGYSGTITVAATDGGGGTGATFAVGNIPQLPTGAELTYISGSTHALRASGGFVTVSPAIPKMMSSGTYLKLKAAFNSGLNASVWQVWNPTFPSFASSALPTANSNNNGATIIITGAASGKWMARSNGTNWIYTDGTTAP